MASPLVLQAHAQEPAQAVRSLPSSNPEDARWDDRFTPRGIDGPAFALAWDGTGLYAGGDFTTAGDVNASRIGRWDPLTSAWNALGSGLNGVVGALAWDGSGLYAGGLFTTAGGIAASRIARWDPASNTWSALGSGLDPSGHVAALVWDGSGLYVGGHFTTAGGVAARNVARWNPGTGSWSALGSGVDGYRVDALAWDGNGLYACGDFGWAGGAVASHIARWDPVSRAWTALGSGMDSAAAVFALAWDGTGLYAGGSFTTAGGVPADSVARWDPVTSTWTAVGSGINRPVRALAWDGSGLYAGGEFWTVGGISADFIARWDPGTRTWEGVPGAGSGMDWRVLTLAWNGTSLYAGGEFSRADGLPATRIASWDPAASTWSAMPGAGAGMDAFVLALAGDGTDLYAAGIFSTAAGVSAYRIARWNLGSCTWNALGSGMNNVTYALAWSGSALYAGGQFTAAGGVATRCIARWDAGTSTWTALGSGMDARVEALAWSGSNLYAGGWFTTAGGLATNSIAQWDPGTSTWSALGSGMNGGVLALAWDGSGLYAGGAFTFAGGVAANHIARWDPATSTWSALGSGLNGGVSALAWDGSGLYVGGGFTSAGGVAANYIARWDPGTRTWSALGAGMNQNGFVRALTWEGSRLFAGGDFATADGVAASSIAEWDPSASTWSALGSGLSDGGHNSAGVFALAWDGSALVAGGAFSNAGVKPSVNIARWSAALPSDHITGQGLGPPNGSMVRVFMPYGAPTGASFAAYGSARWGTNVAWGNIAGVDAFGQILTGPGPGELLGPHVRAFDRLGTPLAKVSYYAYGTLKFGVNVGTARLDVDATHEVLSGAGPGSVFGPHVRGWNYDGLAVSPMPNVSFYAYGTPRFGVGVQGGNVDGDAWDEMIAGAGPSAIFGPHVRGWNYDGGNVASINKINFNAYTTTGYGVNVASGDVDSDGYGEIATAHGPDPARRGQFLGFDYDNAGVSALSGFAVDPFASFYGGRVGLADLTGDLAHDLLAAPGRDPNAQARVISYTFLSSSLNPIADFVPFSSTYGANVAGGPLAY